MSSVAILKSDLHLEHRPGARFGEFFAEKRDWSDKLLMLPGDLCPFIAHEEWLPFITECSERFDQVIWVPGNHEWYGMEKGEDALNRVRDRILALDNVLLVDNEVVEWRGKRIACATLWSNFWGLDHMRAACRRMIMDFVHIRTPFGPFDTGQCAAAFEESRKFLYSACMSGVDAVMTHFAPSRGSIARQFQGSPIGGYFCTDLLDENWPVPSDRMPKIWVHGHTHARISYSRGPTRIICNPVGYPNEKTGYNGNHGVVTIGL